MKNKYEAKKVAIKQCVSKIFLIILLYLAPLGLNLCMVFIIIFVPVNSDIKTNTTAEIAFISNIILFSVAIGFLKIIFSIKVKQIKTKVSNFVLLFKMKNRTKINIKLIINNIYVPLKLEFNLPFNFYSTNNFSIYTKL